MQLYRIEVSDTPNYYLNGELVKIIRDKGDGYVYMMFIHRGGCAVFRKSYLVPVND